MAAITQIMKFKRIIIINWIFLYFADWFKIWWTEKKYFLLFKISILLPLRLCRQGRHQHSLHPHPPPVFPNIRENLEFTVEVCYWWDGKRSTL